MDGVVLFSVTFMLHAAQQSCYTLQFFHRSFPSVQRHASLHSSQYSRGHYLNECCGKCGSCQPVRNGVSWQPVRHRSLWRRPDPSSATTTCFNRRPTHTQFTKDLHTQEEWGCVEAQQLARSHRIPKCEWKLILIQICLWRRGCINLVSSSPWPFLLCSSWGLCSPWQESVIYLSRWFLRRNHKGLFVDGIHR